MKISSVSNYSKPIKLRSNIRLWYNNGLLHNLWCAIEGCYRITESCNCKFCLTITVDKDHLLVSPWAKSIDNTSLTVTSLTINGLVKSLYGNHIV